MSESAITVLYVDDEEELCNLFQMTFHSPEHNVRVFSDPSQALAFLEEHKVAIVFCDFRMPRMDAPEFYRQMPERLKDRVPFYVVTGLTSAASFEIPDNSGDFSGFYSKPLKSAEIKSLLNSGLADL